MGVSTEKLQSEAPHMVSLVKQVQDASFKKGLDPSMNPAAVLLTADISGSNEMGGNHNYSGGDVQMIGDLALAAGFTFDDDGEVPFSYFASEVIDLGSVTPATSQGFVASTWQKHFGGGTNYLAALDWILGSVDEFKGVDLGRRSIPLEVKFTAPYPVFAIFITDGEPDSGTERAIEEKLLRMSQLPIFVQFIGVGKHNFRFLKGLDDLKGRLIDNAGFFDSKDVLSGGKRIFGGHQSPEERQTRMLEALLNEFPSYYPNARKVGLID